MNLPDHVNLDKMIEGNSKRMEKRLAEIHINPISIENANSISQVKIGKMQIQSKFAEIFKEVTVPDHLIMVEQTEAEKQQIQERVRGVYEEIAVSDKVNLDGQIDDIQKQIKERYKKVRVETIPSSTAVTGCKIFHATIPSIMFPFIKIIKI